MIIFVGLKAKQTLIKSYKKKSETVHKRKPLKHWSLKNIKYPNPNTL